MPIRNRSKFSIIQVFFPLKSLLHRLSVILSIFITMLIIFLSRTNPEMSAKFRSSVNDVTGAAQTVASQPFSAASYVKQKVSEFSSLYEENKKLKEENLKLKKNQDLANIIASENINLRKFLKVVPDASVNYITGRITGESIGPYIKSAFFTEGEDQGIKKGQIVINDQGVVGRISEVGIGSSRILLVTDLNSRIPIITGESQELAIAAGGNGTKLQLIYLPEDSKAKIGEEVYTSGDGAYFPSGLFIGYIDSISDKGATVRPAVDWGRLNFVSAVDYQNKKD